MPVSIAERVATGRAHRSLRAEQRNAVSVFVFVPFRSRQQWGFPTSVHTYLACVSTGVIGATTTFALACEGSVVEELRIVFGPSHRGRISKRG